MARILVAGSVNIDRVWQLCAPVRAGARISYDHIDTRYGGGGYYTGRTLLSLGHTVRLLTRLCDDEPGRQCRAMLEREGFDTSLITMTSGETRPFDILVEPSGERTILFSGRARRPPLAIPASDADLIYLNTLRLDPAANANLCTHNRVIAQFPLAAGETRPAHVLLASRSDIATEEFHDLFAAARQRAGQSLRALVLTDGPAPVRIVDNITSQKVAVPACRPVADTIGAGDVFAAGFIDAYVREDVIVDAVQRGNEIATHFLCARATQHDR